MSNFLILNVILAYVSYVHFKLHCLLARFHLSFLDHRSYSLTHTHTHTHTEVSVQHNCKSCCLTYWFVCSPFCPVQSVQESHFCSVSLTLLEVKLSAIKDKGLDETREPPDY